MEDLPSAINQSFPLRVPAPSIGPLQHLTVDPKRQRVPDTLSRRSLLSARFPPGSPRCCWNERRGIVCVFTPILQRQPGCLLCSAGHVPHAKTPLSAQSRADRTSSESLRMKVEKQERELMRFVRTSSRKTSKASSRCSTAPHAPSPPSFIQSLHSDLRLNKFSSINTLSFSKSNKRPRLQPSMFPCRTIKAWRCV